MNNLENITTNHREYLYNVMEENVLEAVKSIMAKDSSLCSCAVCFYNISAIALNNLKPRYVTTNSGEVFARADKLSVLENTQIMVEIMRAIDIVRNKKMHD